MSNIKEQLRAGKEPLGGFFNILASRLVHLEQKGILVKKPDDTDKRKEVYLLTEKGLDLIPILLEMAGWSAQHDPQTAAPQAWIARVNADKEKMIKLIRETVQSGGSVFSGPTGSYSLLRRFAVDFHHNL